MKCGLIGLPNVGKSTIFSAISKVSAGIGNFPFSTTTAKVALVPVPDERLDRIAGIIRSAKQIPTTIDITDIPGLVQGAASGEGMGNRFLASIREASVLVHVVRGFDDENIVHVNGVIDPVQDIKTVELELILADLQSVERRKEKLQKDSRSSSKDGRKQIAEELGCVEHFQSILEAEKLIYGQALTDQQQIVAQTLQLLTAKPMVYVCNISEDETDAYDIAKSYVTERGGNILPICGRLEAEIAAFDSPEEEAGFLADMGIEEGGLKRIVQECYTLLDLATFFTAGENEARAWSFSHGYTAPKTAGIIHSDFERGFIKAEVYHCEDLFALGSEQAIRKSGKLRLEGKTYLVNDGDVIYFRFNV